MHYQSSRWVRIPGSYPAVWICPERPTWTVVNTAADHLLCNPSQDPRGYQTLLDRLPATDAPEYHGREVTELQPLEELWLHITDHCNLRCSHCLFSSCPETTRSLATEQVCSYIDQARDIACSVYALTGGEPLIHPGFTTIVDHILDTTSAQCAILTNGLLVDRYLKDDWDRERISLQISIDGTPLLHDAIRGAGTFLALTEKLGWLKEHGWHVTLSWCVTRDNLQALPWLIDFAHSMAITTVHFMWHVVRGRGSDQQHPTPDTMMGPLTDAIQRAEQYGIQIDNIEQLKRQLFSPAGTRFDGSSAGVSCAAIGPDGMLYPTAATVGVAALASPLSRPLGEAIIHSTIFQTLRGYSVKDRLYDPWRFLLGGGDFDQQYIASGDLKGEDPYLPLFEQLALWLLGRTAHRYPHGDEPAVLLSMGEYLHACGTDQAVSVCHSTCLLSLHGSLDARSNVKAYYQDATGDKRTEILNPVCYDEAMMSHIPAAYRFRGYGCGSPVLEASLAAGETVLDLGCGNGVECFIAARQVGKTGSVIGVDMLESMLELAREGAHAVITQLGFDNIRFMHGYLEELPLPNESVDVVVSNCVLNLSTDKRALFREIARVLKPGGRLVTADVVCDQEPAPSILHDPVLKGECISGAMTQKDLVAILHESGLSCFTAHKRTPYRVVQDHPFFSLTFQAYKPKQTTETASCVTVCYPGPAAFLSTTDGQRLPAGILVSIPRYQAELLDHQIWQFDDEGQITNRQMESSCCLPPSAASTSSPPSLAVSTKNAVGCMVCGAPLQYIATPATMSCAYCGMDFLSNAHCEQGHFVCDRCHSSDALSIIHDYCLQGPETDPIMLMRRIRNHPSIPLHGPQYHAMVPGILLGCLKRLGASVDDAMIQTAITRGAEVDGGSCGFWGVCGAATGVGIAVSVLLQATPIKAAARQKAQQAVHQVLGEISSHTAARCCQRDCYIALRTGLTLMSAMVGLQVPSPEPFRCTQIARNKECLGSSCPLWP